MSTLSSPDRPARPVHLSDVVAADPTPRQRTEAAIARLIRARYAWWVRALAEGWAPRAPKDRHYVPAVVPADAPVDPPIPLAWRIAAYEPGVWGPADVPDRRAWIQQTPEGREWLAARDEAYAVSDGLVGATVRRILAARGDFTEDARADQVWSAARDRCMHAIDLYNPAKKTAPSTYITRWVTSAVTRALRVATVRNARTIGLDVEPPTRDEWGEEESPEDAWIAALDADRALASGAGVAAPPRLLAEARRVRATLGTPTRRRVVG